MTPQMACNLHGWQLWQTEEGGKQEAKGHRATLLSPVGFPFRPAPLDWTSVLGLAAKMLGKKISQSR